MAKCATASLLSSLPALLVTLWAASVLAAPPTLSHLYPAGGQRGSEFTVTCSGQFDWPVNAWAPGISVSCSETPGQLKVAIPGDLATDRVWLRLHNGEGASALLPLLIGSLPEVTEQEPNNAPTNAQRVETNQVTVNGALQESGDVDGFAIALEAGQTLVAVMDAHERLGSPMDSIMQVVTADGYVVAANHDDVGLDPRLTFTPAHSGTYIVRVFAFPSEPDTGIAFRGGANYIYRLTLTTGPYVTHALPLTLAATDANSVELLGWNVPGGTRAPVVPLGNGRLIDQLELESTGDLRNATASQIGFAFANGLAGAARVRLAPHATVTEMANGTAEPPQLLTPSTAVTGWIHSPKQTDRFRLMLKQGEPVVIAVESHHLSLPLHPAVKLWDPAGAVVASAEPAEPNDAIIIYTAPQDGEYQLTVADRYRLGGERCFYRLSVRSEQTDFDLSAATDTITISPDQAAEIPITIQRRTGKEGAPGAISIEAVQLPPGVTAAPVISETSGDTAGSVTLKFTAAGPAFSGPIRIVGKCSQPAELQRFARTPAKFDACFDVFWLTVMASSR